MNGVELMASSFIERYLAMFRFQGWFFHDVTLGVVYGISLLFGIGLFRMMFRRKKTKKVMYSYQKQVKEAVFTFPSLISFWLSWLLFFLLISNFALFVFGGGMSRGEITLDSSGGMSGNQLVVGKWRRSMNDGSSNGGTTWAYQVSGLDVKEGKLRWNRRSNGDETLIGQMSEGIILLQRKKGQISLLDSQTGKDKWQFKEFETTFPMMKSNWSQLEKDYLVTGDSYLYTHGLDGQYYQLDLKNKKAVIDPAFSQLFLDQSPTQVETQLTVEELEKETNESFFNSELLAIEDQAWYFIAHSETSARDSQGILSAVSRESHQIKWQIPLGTPLSSKSFVTSFTLDRHVYFSTNGFSFIITKEDGHLDLIFDHLTNRRV